MIDVYETMRENGIRLPDPPPKGGVYTPVIEFGSGLLYCSGCGPQLDGDTVEAARNCMLNLLANQQAKLGDLNRIKRFVKVLAFVNCTDDFTAQPQVVNGGSELLLALFGPEKGCPARTAIGTNALPGGIAVEIEVLVEYE